MALRQTYICDLTAQESENPNDFTVILIGAPGGEPREFIVHEDAMKEELEEGESILARLFFKDE